MRTSRKTTIDGLIERAVKRSLTVPGVPLGGPGPWIAPVFENAWVNYELGFEKAAYRRGPDGRVQLRGLIKHTPSAAPAGNAFILPAGFRPSEEKVFIAYGILASVGNGVIRVDVAPTGAVVVFGDNVHAMEYLSLSQISFYTD